MRKWTENEISYLNKNYKHKTDKEIAKVLNRTRNSVSHKRKRIMKDRKIQHWKENEISFLKDNYNKMGLKYCSKYLNKTYGACRSKAHELGLKTKPYRNMPKKEIDKETWEFGYVLGVLCGDGYISFNENSRTYTIGLYVRDREFRDNFSKILEKLTRLRPKEHEKNRYGKPFYITSLHSKSLCEFIMKFGEFKSSEWKVPKIVEKGNINIKSGFLSGIYDSDGYHEDNAICITSSNKKALKSLKKLIENLGGEGNIYKKRKQIKEINGRKFYTEMYVLRLFGCKGIENMLKSQIHRKQRLLRIKYKHY